MHFEYTYLLFDLPVTCHFCGFWEILFWIHPHAIWSYASHNLALLWFLRNPILISTIWSYASHNQALLWLFWNPLLNLPTIWSYVFNNMPLLWPFMHPFSSVPGIPTYYFDLMLRITCHFCGFLDLRLWDAHNNWCAWWAT